MHDLAELTDHVFALHAEMVLQLSELEQLRNRVARAERKSCSASRKTKKTAVYEAAGLAGQRRDLPTSA